MATEVRNLYFKGNRIRNDTIAGFQALMTDVWFLYGIDLNARLQSEKSTGRTFFTAFVSLFISSYDILFSFFFLHLRRNLLIGNMFFLLYFFITFH